MRAFTGLVMILAIAGFTAAQEKEMPIDGKKLIGKWKPSDEKAPVTIEFTDKGKITMSIELGGKTEKIEGTYKLDKNKLEMALAFGGKEEKETITILKLTDEVMVGKDSKGKEETLKKVKAEKK